MDEITQMIDEANSAHVVDNDKKTLQEPPSTSGGTPNIPAAIKKNALEMIISTHSRLEINCFGSGEPIRRMVNIIGEFKK